MRILQINAVYGYSSTGTIVKSIRDRSIQSGIEAYVAFPKGCGRIEENTFEIGSLIDHKLHALLSRMQGKQAYFSRWSTGSLIRYMKHIKPDIVHLHNLHSNYVYLNMILDYLAKNDIATVITMHDCWYFTGGCFHFSSAGCDRWRSGCGNCPKRMSDTPAYFSDESESILRDRVRYLSAIPRLTMVGCSEWIASECRRSLISATDVRCIHNGFDLSVFKPVESDWKRRLEIPEDKFVIIAPATKWLMEENRPALDYFLDRMSDDMVMVVFGAKGDDHPSSDKLKTIGHVSSREMMAGIYSMADVMVNCSKEDTLSSINIEAQACGTPVVAYDATGNPETVCPEAGYVVEAGQYLSLFDRMTEIKRIGKSRLSARCVGFVRENYELNSSYKKYIDLYHSIL